MSETTLFPASESDVLHPLEEIARRLRCDSDIVASMFFGVGMPEWSTPEHLAAIKETTHAINEAARYAANLRNALLRLSSERQRMLIEAGAVTHQQIGYLLSQLSEDSADLDAYSARFNRAGGRNPAAHIVAEAMRRIFRRLRKPITYGQLSAGGGPSTEFGREVEFALGAYGLTADWRRPTEAAVNKQWKRDDRLRLCLAARQSKNGLKTGWKTLDLSGVKIESTTSNGGEAFLISLPSRPDIPALCASATMFKSGREVEEFAIGWASRVQLHDRNTN